MATASKCSAAPYSRSMPVPITPINLFYEPL
jgi:hypothetical protein